MAKNADHAEQPVVNYLLAAEAAQQRGDEARANQHLERAAQGLAMTPFRMKSPVYVCNWPVIKTMLHATAWISC